ncbi:U3 small nucleolar ribonucleoprotein IMP4 [Dictyocoela muelleri]|nr:U3 small nucleolar ribonucleoprotein IMP4 [Dictyocoela muelleri]
MKRKIKEYIKRCEKEENRQKDIETIKNCYLEGRKVPYHLRNDALKLMDEIIYEGKNQLPYDILVTGGSSSFGKKFVKTFSLIIGGKPYKNERDTEMHGKCLVVVGENKGLIDRLVFSFFPYGPTFHFQVSNFKMKNRIRNYSPRPKVIFENFNNPIGLKVFNSLKMIFPKTEAKRVVVFKNENDLISFRHYFFDKELQKDVLQFEMTLFKVSRGTYQNEEEDWVLRRFINSKKNVI